MGLEAGGEVGGGGRSGSEGQKKTSDTVKRKYRLELMDSNSVEVKSVFISPISFVGIIFFLQRLKNFLTDDLLNH